MAKKVLTAAQAFDLRQLLHVATLEALMASRRWQPGDLVFQGGTSLHLAHGSPRLSEDLDFMVNSSLKLGAIQASILQRLQSTMTLPEGAKLSIKPAKDDHNPHAFDVSIGGENMIGGVRLKIELWKTDKQALDAIKATVAPIRTVGGLQTFVPTAELSEIYADKVFALANRDRIKPRDVFDLHWLVNHHQIKAITEDKMRVRLATYPDSTPADWLAKAFDRRAALAQAAPAIAKDLKRWLPSSWPMDEEQAAAMAQTAIDALGQGIDVMRVIRDGQEQTRDQEGPSR
ncbi:nucleotidyl transferase AbiEii/AbiGii toxin family protein [Paracidovorax wautersii]|uniref:Nucleotidyl transferase AbiEii toxin, Type IV TA system n=1 Tax=Paracidovorax wautersii TaxID=1177982 RepID=A0A1I2HXD3_9BURK|nr:nucleotidyl transferase AbiEii/AbiGii toxin family protein [Paracidovorax wautersii]SFF34512.1 Nucleotidyl transferase AbiEii toxin, Type IV TA system [Paracidovorax wautersii]